MEGLQFSLPTAQRATTYLSAFSGVLENGELVRIWGVARDVTELVVLNEQLQAKQERLRVYARQLVGAEERARRATAVDLHDGIGQQLVGLGMTIESAASRATPEVRLLLSEATQMMREVQAVTQRVIADLSPPGLYDLGLEPALKWLAVSMRGKEHLQVEVQVSADDSAFDLDLRVLVYKLARELLRNVVKHARVDAATVIVDQTPLELRMEVIDHGVGFEWQPSLGPVRHLSDRGAESQSLLRQRVLDPDRRLGNDRPLNDPFLLELLESLTEHAVGDVRDGVAQGGKTAA